VGGEWAGEISCLLTLCASLAIGGELPRAAVVVAIAVDLAADGVWYDVGG
jgi:hypothetical protein